MVGNWDEFVIMCYIGGIAIVLGIIMEWFIFKVLPIHPNMRGR